MSAVKRITWRRQSRYKNYDQIKKYLRLSGSGQVETGGQKQFIYVCIYRGHKRANMFQVGAGLGRTKTGVTARVIQSDAVMNILMFSNLIIGFWML